MQKYRKIFTRKMSLSVLAISLLAGSLIIPSSISQIYAAEVSSSLVNEKEKIEVTKFVEKVISKKYEVLISGNLAGLKDLMGKGFNKESIEKIDHIFNAEKDLDNKRNIEYTKVDIMDIRINSISKINENIEVKLNAKVKKDWRYKHSPKDNATTNEALNHVITLKSVNNTFELVNYWFENDFDLPVAQSSSNKLTIQDMINEQIASGKSLIESNTANQQHNTLGITATNYTYNRGAAYDYAEAHWDSANPNYRTFTNNCTNFISQVIHEGGGVNMDWGGDLVWWYQGTQNSTSWSVAHDYVYFGNRNTDSDGGLGHYYISNVTDLKTGSLVGYDFNQDGFFDHLAVVVGKDSQGNVFVAQNTYNAWYKDYRSSDPTTNYYFIQTNDTWSF